MRMEKLTKFNRGQSSKIFKSVVETGNPVVVTQHNAAMVVIMTPEEYMKLTQKTIQVELPIYEKELED